MSSSRKTFKAHARALSRFPGQEHVSGSSKIPSILCYDRLGKLRAVGAEVYLAENVEKAEDEDWVKVEWSVTIIMDRDDCFDVIAIGLKSA